MPTTLQIRKQSGSNNNLRVDIGPLSLWWSYDTIIAFQSDHHSRRVSENLWGPTTGKHLNAIDNGEKKTRLPRAEFEKSLNAVLKAHNLTIQ